MGDRTLSEVSKEKSQAKRPKIADYRGISGHKSLRGPALKNYMSVVPIARRAKLRIVKLDPIEDAPNIEMLPPTPGPDADQDFEAAIKTNF